jgi:hypothetical protein
MPHEQILEFVDYWAEAERQSDARELDRLMADDSRSLVRAGLC